MTTALATADTDQELLESTARTVVAQGILVLSTYVNGANPDPEVVIKIINSKIADIGKTVPEKKVNPMAGLPVLHITITNGRLDATLTVPVPTPDADVIDMEEAEEVKAVEVDPETVLALPAPSAVMRAQAAINADADQAFADLCNELGSL